MRIAIAGGSGFIGRKLTEDLLGQGHEVVILTSNDRLPAAHDVPHIAWLKEGSNPEKQLGHVDVIINLAGVSINNGRWTAKHQQQIYSSRITATDELIRICAAMERKPAALLNASAIGIYPASLDAVYTEESTDIADDFLGRTVADWESKAKQAERLGIRTVLLRFGVVLGQEGGALPLMALPYKLFVGGPVGSGRQWVSWIHLQDVVRAVSFAVHNHHVHGAVNVVSPSPLRMGPFGETLGNVLKRPHWLPVPAFALTLALGRKSKLILEGQHVVPQVLIDGGFDFQFPELRTALEDIFHH